MINRTYRPRSAGAIDRTDPFATTDRLILLRRQANHEQMLADAQAGAPSGLLDDLHLCAALASQHAMEQRLSALIATDPVLRAWASSACLANPTTHRTAQPSAPWPPKRRAWATQVDEVVDVAWRELPPDAEAERPGGCPTPP